MTVYLKLNVAQTGLLFFLLLYPQSFPSQLMSTLSFQLCKTLKSALTSLFVLSKQSKNLITGFIFEIYIESDQFSPPFLYLPGPCYHHLICRFVTSKNFYYFHVFPALVNMPANLYKLKSDMSSPVVVSQFPQVRSQNPVT